MISSRRTFLYTLPKLLALPWFLATYQPSPAGPARRRLVGKTIGRGRKKLLKEGGLYVWINP